jgi:hypothetical protein
MADDLHSNGADSLRTPKQAELGQRSEQDIPKGRPTSQGQDQDDDDETSDDLRLAS